MYKLINLHDRLGLTHLFFANKPSQAKQNQSMSQKTQSVETIEFTDAQLRQLDTDPNECDENPWD